MEAPEPRPMYSHENGQLMILVPAGFGEGYIPYAEYLLGQLHPLPWDPTHADCDPCQWARDALETISDSMISATERSLFYGAEV